MRQLNVPKKLTATVQIWVSVLLLVIATSLSLTPIITLTTGDNIDTINEMIGKVAPDSDFVIPEEVDVSAIKLVKSIGVMSKIMSATMKGVKDKDVSNTGSEIAAILDTPEGQETIVIAISMVSTVASNFDKEDTDTSGVLASVLTMMVSIIALLALLALTFIIPIMLAWATITALVSALVNLDDPEEVSTKIARKLPGFISMPFTLMLFQCVVPGMTYGSGIVGVCVASILAAVLGLVISRLRSYDDAAFRYLNIVQGVSLVGVIGFVVFFFNLVKTNIFTTFLRGDFAKYVAEVGVAMAKNKNVEVQNGYAIDLLLILIYVVLALASVGYLEKCAQRLACSKSANKKGAFPKDTCIGRAIVMLAVYILPAVVVGRKSYFEDPTDMMAKEGTKSFLELNGDQAKAFTMVLVGAIIIFMAEIALIVLKAVFCKGMNAESMNALMSGADTAPVAEEAAEVVEATEETETAEAEEATAEETVEEVVSEVAEEAVEEAPAEEVNQ